MLENAVDLQMFTYSSWPSPPSQNEPLRVLFVGRLMPFKALGLLLQAVAQVSEEFPIELKIIGDGPMGAVWRDDAQRLGIANKVTFLGSLGLEEVAAAMRLAHVFCLPSVRESGGAVLLEAMASARPVVAIAFGGPAEIVDDSVGRAIPLGGVEDTVAALAEALRDVVHDPDHWKGLGENGYRRARESFSWEVKIDQALKIYRDLLSVPDQPQTMSGNQIQPGIKLTG